MKRDVSYRIKFYSYLIVLAIGVALGWTGRQYGEKSETVTKDAAVSRTVEKETVTIKRPSGETETRVVTRNKVDSSASTSKHVEETVSPRRYLLGISQGVGVTEIMGGYKLMENLAVTGSVNTKAEARIGIQVEF